MLNRWIGILAALVMLAANVALLWRDVLPGWWAGDPPPSAALVLGPGEERQAQVGIYDGAGRTVGKSWTRSRRAGLEGVVQVSVSTVLEPMALPGGLGTPRARIETELTYRRAEATIDELDFRVFGLGLPLSLHGEAMPSGEFPCQWQVGPQRGAAVLDSRAPAALGDVIRPFDRLPNLYVGRSWRLNLLDPLSHLLPQVNTSGLEMEPVLIQVTGKETIEHDGRSVMAYVVEGGGATAWVAEEGTVLRQTVNVPLLGALVLLDEPFDDQARRQALRAVPMDWGPESHRERPHTGPRRGHRARTPLAEPTSRPEREAP
jgi:hypothetical protein